MANFIESLEWRGMLHDSTPGVIDHLASGMRTGYIGFDPTAPSLTIGNYVQIMLLKLLQDAGHRPIVLMGGATGRIGDPSGKDKERELKSFDELDNNLQHQMAQFGKFLNFDEGPNKAMFVNNLDFYANMDVLSFLRDVGKTLTVNYMMSKDSVQRRLDTGISFTEFSYQLLQAYDYQKLFVEHGVTLQMGGSDQWGNITSGTEFIRRNLGEKAYAATTPLLTKSDGSKFGKSEKGNLWLDPEMTSPYAFYQFWINADDADIPKFLSYFTLKPREEVLELMALIPDNPRAAKEALAAEITERVHSKEDLTSVEQVSAMLFGKAADPEVLKGLTVSALKMIAGELDVKELPRDIIANGASLVDVLTDHTGIQTSKSEARRNIQNNAVTVNKVKVSSVDEVLHSKDALQYQYIMIEVGKKNKTMLKLVD